MTLRVALVLEGDAAGAERAVDQTRSKFEQMVAGIEAANRKAAQSLADTNRKVAESATAIDGVASKAVASTTAAGAKFQQMVAGIDAAGRKAAQGFMPFSDKVPAALKLSTQQMQNMAFQMNDIGTMLASGQSPFVLMMQQGMQIAQIFGPGVGVAAALKAAGAAALAFATNPLTLTVLGLAVAAGAAKALWSALSGSGEADRAMERHLAIVDEAKRKYVEAGGKAREWFNEIERFSQFEKEQNVRAAERALKDIMAGGLGISSVGGQSSLTAASMVNVAQLLPNGNAFGDQARELLALNEQVTANKMSIKDYEAALDQLGRSTTIPTVRSWAEYLLDASQKAVDASNILNAAKRAAGIYVPPTSEELAAARGNTIGQLNALGTSRDFNSAFGVVDKESQRAAKKQSDELQRLADTWRDKAAPAVERYGRALAELDSAKGYFASEQEYMRARLFLQDEMNTAVEKERRTRLAQATDFRSGLQRGLEDYARTAMNVAENIEQATKHAFAGMEETLVGFAETGKLSFSELARSILSDLARISIRQGITGPLASGLSSVLSSFFGGGGVGAPMNLLPTNHGGFGPGDPLVGTRLVPASVIARAPRYHSGVGPGERAAVLRNDESVLTPGQMRAMGGQGVTVKLELVTAQGAPVAARDGGRRTEGNVDVQRLIVGAVASDIAGGGPLSRLFEGTYPAIGRRKTIG